MEPIGWIDGILERKSLVSAAHSRVTAHSGGTLGSFRGFWAGSGARGEGGVFLLQVLFPAGWAGGGDSGSRVAAAHQLLEPVPAGIATIFIDGHDPPIIHTRGRCVTVGSQR